MDEFEGLVEPRQPDEVEQTGDEEQTGQEHEEDGRRKRQRIEGPAAQALTNQAAARPTAPALAPAAEPSKGILSAHALESLKYMASLKQQQQAQTNAPPVKAAAGGLGGLAGYGSDSEDE